MITAVVAVRKGSQRVPNKNIKPFGESNLLEMKLKVLLQVNGIDEIVVMSIMRVLKQQIVSFIKT